MTQRRAEQTGRHGSVARLGTATRPFGGGGRRYDPSVWW